VSVASALMMRSNTGTVGRQKLARSVSLVQPHGPGATTRGMCATAAMMVSAFIHAGRFG
jgi:hypothetical protein